MRVGVLHGVYVWGRHTGVASAFTLGDEHAGWGMSTLVMVFRACLGSIDLMNLYTAFAWLCLDFCGP